MTKTSILALALLCGGFTAAGASAQTAVPTAPGAFEKASGDLVTGPVITTPRGPDRGQDGAHYPDKPDGVPTELHRKVVKLYKRIHNAHPDASRKRIFQKIGQELGINPRRLWNAYHTPRDPDVGPPIVDARRVDAARDTRTRDVRPAATRSARRDRAGDRRVRDRRATRRPPARVRRDRPARPARPQRGR